MPAIVDKRQRSVCATGTKTHALTAEGFDASEDGTGRGNPIVSVGRARRLTPTECERLQGFPDNWTAVPYRNKPAADGPRYKSIGNSMAVPCMRWISERIAMMDRMLQEINNVPTTTKQKTKTSRSIPRRRD